VKRVLYLVIAALVAMMILVPAAMAQTMETTVEREITAEGPLPKSGGVPIGSVLVPAAALLLGSGVIGYAALRRRR
jgi:hypothetical protein